MKINGTYVLRHIGDDWLLVPVGRTLRENRGLFPLTETGADIWRLLPSCTDAQAVADALTEVYDAPREVLLADVRAFLDELRKLGVIA